MLVHRNRVPTTAEYLQLGRMYLYDGTFAKPTTMGWLAFELSRIPTQAPRDTSGLTAAQLLLEEALASYFGQGNLAAYRGSSLYDPETTPELAELWHMWVSHYKQYRSILSSDVVHVMRPSGANIEVSMHVDPSASGKDGDPIAFANLFNPTSSNMTVNLHLPMYYAGAGINEQLQLSWGGSLLEPTRWTIPPSSIESVLADYSVRINVNMEKNSFLWVALYEANP